MKKQTIIILIFLIPAFAVSLKAETGPAFAIIKCRIHPVVGAVVEDGCIVLRDGLIETLGPRTKVKVPADASVFDASGLFAYPGLIDALSSDFFSQPKEESEPSPNAGGLQRRIDDGKHPGLSAFENLKASKNTVKQRYKDGFTSILVAPQKGIFAGQSVLLNIYEKNFEQLVVKNPVALHVSFITASGVYPSSVMGTMALLRQSILDARHYSMHKSLYEKKGRNIKRPEYDPFLEKLVPYAVEGKRIFFNCQDLEDIKRALRLIKEYNINGVICGAVEAWRVAGMLKESGVPLIVSVGFTPPRTSKYALQGEKMKEKAEKEILPANPARLYKEGISFALTSYGLKKKSELKKNVKLAIEAGLPKEEAIRAWTIHPARYIGVESVLGSIEPGKIANIILVTEELFEKDCQIARVYVDGIAIEMEVKPKKTSEKKETKDRTPVRKQPVKENNQNV
ncbi:MAG: amidohydrolase family protein [Candidatus Aminicenantes bacterium]|nr:amidohydrolase family protein [Candidatus Aminicenantes bacterium]